MSSGGWRSLTAPSPSSPDRRTTPRRGRSSILRRPSDRSAPQPMVNVPRLEFLTGPGLGCLLGMRHALEPDHLAAVSTLVTRERNTTKAALLGACWGLGHTGSLIAVGTALVLLQAEMSDWIADSFECGVALMLIALGLRAMCLTARQGAAAPAHMHRHADTVHGQPRLGSHVHVGAWTLSRWPLMIGAMHGLAGSGALTTVAVAALPSTATRITYLALFGLGSTLGMAVLSGLLGWPLARFARNRRLAGAVSLGVGSGSIVLGLWWAYSILGRLLIS